MHRAGAAIRAWGASAAALPPSFHPTERLRLKRLTLIRYVSRQPREIWFHTLRDLPTGFGRNAVVLDGGAR